MATSTAQQGDFFGGGMLPGSALSNVSAPQRTIEQMQEEERQRIAANYARGLDANGQQLPAYGTPRSAGGTASGYQVQSGTGPRTTTFSPGAGGVQQPGRNTSQVVGEPLAGDYNHTGAFVPGTQAAGAPGTDINDDLTAARGLADEVLGARPTVDPNNAVTNANIDRLTPVIDPNLARNDEIDRAFSMSSDLVDQIMNAPSQTAQISDRVLSNQLALGRSSPGGIGNVQAGIKTAMGAAPALQRDASQQAIQEQQARAAAATGAANIYAGVAAGTADRAVEIGKANQGAALGVMSNLTTLTGFDYQFDTAQMGAIGQLARDFFNNAQAFAQMDVTTQIAQWNDLTARYGIDKNFKAAMEGIAASENIGPLDAMKLVLGGVSAVGGLAAA